jgi:hypothetical protein
MLIQTSQTGGEWYSDTSPFPALAYNGIVPTTKKKRFYKIVPRIEGDEGESPDFEKRLKIIKFDFIKIKILDDFFLPRVSEKKVAPRRSA